MTVQEYNVLNELAYLDFGFDGTDTSGSLQQICQNIAAKSGTDTPTVIQAVANGTYPGLSNLTYVGGRNNNNINGFVGYAFQNDDTVICAFRGSEGPIDMSEVDWRDNFVAGATGDSVQYESAVNFAIDMSKYGKMEVTGHSKGGNLAMYVASQVNNCERGIVFDAHGFPPGYMTDAEIARMQQSNITNYVTDNDVVGALLEHYETRVFVECIKDTGYLDAHRLDNMAFTSNGLPIVSRQSIDTAIIGGVSSVIAKHTSVPANISRARSRINAQNEILVSPEEIENAVSTFCTAQDTLKTANASMERALDALNTHWIGPAAAALRVYWYTLNGNIRNAEEKMQDAIDELKVTHQLFTSVEESLSSSISLLSISDSPFS